MGSVGGLLGTAGGFMGTGISGPQSAPIQAPTTNAQANTAYNANQTALQQQQALLNALQGQGGIQNQSNVYGQLQNIAAGQGPNPAQAMLNQATGANTANQAALMAGQRGASQNVGLIARQAAQQGAANQQNAAGQGATMQAQQSLNALGAAGNLANTMAGQQIGATGAVTSANQAEQQALLNAIAQQNNANVGMQSNINSANAGLANTVMQGQQATIGGLLNGASSMSSMMGSGGGAAAAAAKGGRVQNGTVQWYDEGGEVDSDDPAPSASASASESSESTELADQAPKVDTSGPQQFAANPGAAKLEKSISDIPKTIMMMGGAEGGVVPGAYVAPTGSGAQSSFGQFIANNNNMSGPQLTPVSFTEDTAAKGLQDAVSNSMKSKPSKAKPKTIAMAGGPGDEMGMGSSDTMMAAHGGKVPALLSPGERYLSPKEVKKVEKGEKSPMKAGEKIPGKPKVPGAVNSYANDFVRKNLDEGGIVLPRSVTQAKHPHWAAHKFVSQIMAKKGSIPKKGSK